jgi:3-oxoacyl-[acyl-carrier protein] reductase
MRGAFGRIDILVNNVGGRRPQAANAWFDLTAADWLDTFNINVVSAVRLIKILAGPMRQRGWGRIIIIIINSSSLGGQSTSGQLAEYAAAKAAMNNLTVGWASRTTSPSPSPAWRVRAAISSTERTSGSTAVRPPPSTERGPRPRQCHSAIEMARRQPKLQGQMSTSIL